MARASPVDDLVEQIRSRLHAARTPSAERIAALIALAEAYQEAVDLELAARFAEAHALPRPPTPKRSAATLAAALRDAVAALPELTRAPTAAASAPPPAPAAAPPAPPDPQPPVAATVSEYAALERALVQAPLVVVGGVPKREKLRPFPAVVREHVEWIDTTRQGTHAIGNLERRIRERRVAAVLILEGLVSHRHSDPLVSAARHASVPHASGGKGGAGALAQALRELSRQLERT